jgi:two-component system chemotaxis response regulator CheY
MAPPLQTILFVDDDVDLHLVITYILRTAGYTVVCCESGVDALEQAPAVQPDLLLLDAMLPEMDGMAILQALRRTPACEATPAIFLTANDFLDLAAAHVCGAVLGMISKPVVEPQMLLATLRRFWEAYHDSL